MDKTASIAIRSKDGKKATVKVSASDMALMGIEKGWISPSGIFSNNPGRNISVKIASKQVKINMNAQQWLNKSLDAGWIWHDDKGSTHFIIPSDSMSKQAMLPLLGMAAQAKYWYDNNKVVRDATGRAVDATVNAAGKVLDKSGRIIGEVANAALRGANAVAGAAQNVAQFSLDAAGVIRDAAGKAIQARVDTEGRVVDAAGRFLGNLVNRAGQLAGAAKDAYTKQVAQGKSKQ